PRSVRSLEPHMARLKLHSDVRLNRLQRLFGARDLQGLGDQRLTLAFDRPDLRGLVRVGDDALIVHPAVRLRLGESAHRQRDQPDQTWNGAELHGGPPQYLTRPKSRSAAGP